MQNRRILLAALFAMVVAIPSLAQGPLLDPPQMDDLVQRIALYPDPLLTQVLTASTYWNEIPDAAAWASQHSYLSGDALARAIDEDRLPWDPSVLALLPFPSVLDMMGRDPGWTAALGNAVLAQRADVMDAIQRMRQEALSYGYLRDSPYCRVVSGQYIEILPVDPAFLYVPRYDPRVVFVRPRSGIVAGGAISFGPRITIGAAFAPFGWSNPMLGWREHAIVIDHHPWERTIQNREHYVHPYAAPPPHHEGPRVERHEHGHSDHEHDRK